MSSASTPSSRALPDFDPDAIVDLDLREELRAGTPPLARIIERAESLGPGGVLHLRTPFQPRPLFALLGQRGFVHHSQSFADDDWSSYFWRDDAPPTRRVLADPPATTAHAPVGPLDLRLLHPPEPLVLILERAGMSSEPFEVLLTFDPELLHSLLAAQGWQATLIESGTDGVRLRMTVSGAPP